MNMSAPVVEKMLAQHSSPPPQPYRGPAPLVHKPETYRLADALHQLGVFDAALPQAQRGVPALPS